jgi:hypothetical protein
MPTSLRRTTLAALGLLLVTAAACAPPRPAGTPSPPTPSRAEPRTGETLLREMHERYAGRWYTSLATTLSVTLRTRTGSEFRQSWYESRAVPGRLRLDIGPPADGNGSLVRGDTTWSVQARRVAAPRVEVNDRLVLTADVYSQPPARTATQLRLAGYDLSRIHEGTWQGVAVWIVGAGSGDSTTRQFWVERDRLLPVRMIIPGAQGRTDVRLREWQPAGGGWVATVVEEYLDGALRSRATAATVRHDLPLDARLFLPASFTTAPHWHR